MGVRIDEEGLQGGIAQVLLGGLDLILTQGSAVTALASGFVGTSVGDLGSENDQGGLFRVLPGGLEGVGYGGGIISSAVDGLRAAEAILEGAGATRETL